MTLEVLVILIAPHVFPDLSENSLKPGMTQAQVEKILGKGVMRSDSTDGNSYLISPHRPNWFGFGRRVMMRLNSKEVPVVEVWVSYYQWYGLWYNPWLRPWLKWPPWRKKE